MKLEEATILALQGKLTESKDNRLTVYEIVNRATIDLEHKDLIEDYKFKEVEPMEEDKISYILKIMIGDALGFDVTTFAKDLERSLNEQLTDIRKVYVYSEEYTDDRTQVGYAKIAIDIYTK